MTTRTAAEALEEMRRGIVTKPHGTYLFCRGCGQIWWENDTSPFGGERHNSDCWFVAAYATLRAALAPPPEGEVGTNERERLTRTSEEWRDRALHLEHLEAVALRYRDLWLICHENNPRAPEDGELNRLGHLRGLLFASAVRTGPSLLRATQSNGHSPDDALAPSNGNPFPSRPVESPAPSTPAQEGESTREQIDAGWVADLAYEDELKKAGYTYADRRERVRRILRAARLLRATQAQPLTDAQIVEIRDDHLPSQGEPFDCLAFARAVLRATQSNQPISDASCRPGRYGETPDANTHGETGNCADQSPKLSDGEPIGPANNDASSKSDRKPASHGVSLIGESPAQSAPAQEPVATLEAKVSTLLARALTTGYGSTEAIYALANLAREPLFVAPPPDEARELLREVVRRYDDYRGKGVMPAPGEYQMVVGAIERIRAYLERAK